MKSPLAAATTSLPCQPTSAPPAPLDRRRKPSPSPPRQNASSDINICRPPAASIPAAAELPASQEDAATTIAPPTGSDGASVRQPAVSAMATMAAGVDGGRSLTTDDNRRTTQRLVAGSPCLADHVATPSAAAAAAGGESGSGRGRNGRSIDSSIGVGVCGFSDDTVPSAAELSEIDVRLEALNRSVVAQTK